VHRAHRVAAKLRAGTVWVNAYRVLAPNARSAASARAAWAAKTASTRSTIHRGESDLVELTGATRDPFKLG
jgi:aldehyde dehydrogenase (NAD+)